MKIRKKVADAIERANKIGFKVEDSFLRLPRKSRSKKYRKEVIKKKCKYCKATEDLTIDHKNPVSKGGTNDINNLQTLCRRCNQNKSSLSDKQVRFLFKWFLEIQESRIKTGKKPYKLS